MSVSPGKRRLADDRNTDLMSDFLGNASRPGAGLYHVSHPDIRACTAAPIAVEKTGRLESLLPAAGDHVFGNIEGIQ